LGILKKEEKCRGAQELGEKKRKKRRDCSRETGKFETGQRKRDHKNAEANLVMVLKKGTTWNKKRGTVSREKVSESEG